MRKIGLSILAAMFLGACTTTPPLIVYNVTSDFDFQIDNQVIELSFRIPTSSGRFEELQLNPQLDPTATYAWDDEQVLLYSKPVRSGCYRGLAFWWVTGANSLNSLQYYYNFPTTCISSGELIYVGNFRVHAVQALTDDMFLRIDDFDGTVRDLSDIDLARLFESMPQDAQYETSIAVPFDLTEEQIEILLDAVCDMDTIVVD